MNFGISYLKKRVSKQMADQNCTIQDLKITSFQMRTYLEKVYIVRCGRPCPQVGNQQHFNTSQYNKTVWLAGSEKLGKLFCWPCLLFSEGSGVWNSSGYKNFQNLPLNNAIRKHESTQDHIISFLNLKSFENSCRLNEHENVELRNETVKKNKEVLKRLIDAVSFLVIYDLPFQEHFNGEDIQGSWIYEGALNFLSTYDCTLNTYLKHSTTFCTNLERIQNDLIHAVREVVLTKIKEEVNNSTYVALLVNEISDTMYTLQLAIALRYVLVENGDVQERFISLIDIRDDTSVEALCNCIAETVDVYDLRFKLVAFTYNGAAVRAQDLGMLREKVQNICPNAKFVHSFGHPLTHILSQSFSSIGECWTFFQTLTELTMYFSKSTKRIDAFFEFVKSTKERLMFSSFFIHTVKNHRMMFKIFFQRILDNCENWDQETVAGARLFISFLTDFKTVFLLSVFNEIFSFTEVLYSIFQTKQLNVVHCAQKLKETIEAVKNYKNLFHFTWTQAGRDGEKPPNKQRRQDKKTEEEEGRQLHSDIVDTVVMQLEERFCSLSVLGFTSLLDPSKYSMYRKLSPLTLDTLRESLSHSQPMNLDLVRLQTELLVLYSYEELSNKEPQLLLNYLTERKLDTVLPQVFKLALLTVTMPSTSAPVGSSSVLCRLRSYLGSRTRQNKHKSLPVLFLEKEILHQLKITTIFHDCVISEFNKIEDRPDFSYK